MPNVNVSRDKLFENLGQTYTQDEFEELCFDFGIELDDVTSEGLVKRKEAGQTDADINEEEEIIYRIEVPANRYDLLCIEGISAALNVFRSKAKTPMFRTVAPASGKLQRMTVKPETAQIRPFVVSAILRNITFTQASYNSFIDLQDKLHDNICRRRRLVAIGTHDLDTIEGPFTYEALAPKDIEFVPLNQKEKMTAERLMEFYKTDLKLRKFLDIIESSPVYPVIYDSKRTVLSLPPIINGDHSKIKLTTKNVLIECTATDQTKAEIVLNTVLSMFSGYCAEPYTIEQVEVVQADGTVKAYPDLTPRYCEVNAAKVNGGIGINLTADAMKPLLERMMLTPVEGASEGCIKVDVPITRSDVFHACDVAEDIGIAYGFNNVVKTAPKTNTVGMQQPRNLLTELLRSEMAFAGFNEALTLALCSHKENFEFLNRPDDGKTAVTLANPKTVEFEVARTTLLPGILKTLEHNKAYPRPVKLFEISDVVLQDPASDVGATNYRHLVALFSGTTSGFEIIHGVLDTVMTKLGLTWNGEGPKGYCIEPSEDPAFFPGRQAKVLVGGKVVGVMGILHPTVLASFDIGYPSSALEISIEPFV